MKKKLTIKINSTYKYLQVWNGIFNLTNKELEVLSVLIDIQDISKEDNISSMYNKKEVAEKLLIKDPNTLNNYIKKFKDKGVLKVKDNNYTLNNLLDPNTDTVEINLIKQ
jgi:hypothetical protein|tara:strand:+ start:3366 stop:3695 length:330 start_codon:yes stop_codon:yes gene_type:complete